MEKTNVLFMLIDDMGWKDLACYGSDFYETPNIDALRERGMAFSNAYASCPVCSPTRGSILTGKYPATLGITDWIDWGGRLHPARGRCIDVPYIKNLPKSELTLASALKEQGYQTWHVGKWHLGGPGHLPEDFGFDVNIGGCHHGSPGAGGYFSPWSIEALKEADVPDGTYLTDYLTDRTLELLESRDPEAPFFLNLWYYQVHTPIQGKPELVEKYREKAKRMGLDKVQQLQKGGAFPCEHKKDKRIIRRLVQGDPVYAAMIESLDDSVGRIMDCLERIGELDNTLIIFTSDNGGLSTAEGSPTSNLPLNEGKGWLYDGGVREPLIITWPGVISPGAGCDEALSSPDFYPTILEALGLPGREEQHCDGKSFLPLLKGDKDFARGAIFWHYPHYGNQGGSPGSVVRDGEWKLIQFYEDDHLELYNIVKDPGEARDLADAEPEIRDRLLARLEAWKKSVEAKIPQPNPEFRAWPHRVAAGHREGV